jgi:peptidoglycan/xylan/chitin deacetylase (PgdA/CDA1 family)
MPIPVTTPYLLRAMAPSVVWSIPEKRKVAYLTFDDGPIPEVTEFVLDTLKQYDAKATFFCIGRNVRENMEIYQRILADGHCTGNHTENHLNGWKTGGTAYYRDIIEASGAIRSKLFRPPYGKIKIHQARTVMQRFRIVMWDVLTYDFHKDVSKEKCLYNATEYVKPGSIIVFHDSRKAQNNLEYALPRTLDILKKKGYKFEHLGAVLS